MTTINDVITYLPLLTPYSMPTEYAKAQAYYGLAETQVNKDAPSLDGVTRTKADCYYIAHLMSIADNSSSLASETLGEASVSYRTFSDNSLYLDEYKKIIGSIKKANLMSAVCTVDIEDVNLPTDRVPMGD